MLVAIILLLVSAQFAVDCREAESWQVDSKCSGRPFYNVSLTAYYPDFNTGIESDYSDVRGKKLRSLQNFLDGRCEYVTVAVDEDLHLNYGSQLCVPELNAHFGKNIPLQVRDHGANLRGHGFSRLDICVRSEEDSYDKAVNRIVTVYAQPQNNNRQL